MIENEAIRLYIYAEDSVIECGLCYGRFRGVLYCAGCAKDRDVSMV